MKVLLVLVGLCVAVFGGFQLVAANEYEMNVAYYGRKEAAHRYGPIGSLLSEGDGWQCAGVGVLMVLIGLVIPGTKKNDKPRQPTGSGQ